MPWELNINSNFKDTSECCLQLSHTEKKQSFRSWFGPLAKHIYIQLQNKFNFRAQGESFQIEKQFAQYTLMQASFHHQRCIYQYQINSDLEANALTGQYDLAELLLFIRMTPQHPSQDTLIEFAQKQMPWCADIDTAINQLLDAKLIQKIICDGHIFYDKNPYPHDHVLDIPSQKLKDFTFDQPIQKNQRLVLSPILS